MFLTNGFSVILLLIVLFHTLNKKKFTTTSGRQFIILLISSILVLLLEILSWLFNGRVAEHYRIMNILFNFLFFIMNSVVPVSWLIYIDFKINNSISRLKSRLFYLPYIGIAIIGLTINLFYPWIYVIDKLNNYQRSFGAILYTIYIFWIIYSSLLFLRNPDCKLNSNVKRAFLYFTLLPLCGAIAQILLPGSLIVWNTVALGLVGSFISLELFNVTRDFLTGLLNRRHFYEILEYKINSGITKGEEFSLIMIDLNDFKLINDELGHVVGDDALVVFSNILKQSCKSRDFIGRFGGDEFIILLTNTSNSGISSVINRVRDNIEKFNSKGIKNYRLSCSIAGVVFNIDKHKTVEAILHEADTLMYKEKELTKAPGSILPQL